MSNNVSKTSSRLMWAPAAILQIPLEPSSAMTTLAGCKVTKPTNSWILDTRRLTNNWCYQKRVSTWPETAQSRESPPMTIWVATRRSRNQNTPKDKRKWCWIRLACSETKQLGTSSARITLMFWHALMRAVSSCWPFCLHLDVMLGPPITSQIIILRLSDPKIKWHLPFCETVYFSVRLRTINYSNFSKPSVWRHNLSRLRICILVSLSRTKNSSP